MGAALDGADDAGWPGFDISTPPTDKAAANRITCSGKLVLKSIGLSLPLLDFYARTWIAAGKA